MGALLVTVVTIGIGMARRFDRIDSRLDQIEHSIDQIRLQGNGHLALTGSLVTALNRQGAISPDELAGILQNFISIGGVLAIPTNPITPEEHERLAYYLDLARAGGPFTPDQVRDYRAIVAILEEEKPQDPDVWGWVALGALLLGIYLLGKQQD